MLDQTQLDLFWQQGFAKGSQVLSDEQVNELKEETLRVVDDHQNHRVLERQPISTVNLTGDPENPVWQIVNIWEGSAAFERLVTHPPLVEEVAQIMSAGMDAHEIRLFHDQVQYKPAHRGGVNPWHQDSPYWPILQPKNVQLTAWVALDDADADNGCMAMVPGSHQWGDNIGFLHSIHDFAAMPRFFQGHELTAVTCPVGKGEVHFHHPLTWHGSGANLSGRPRRAVALHFMTERAVFDAAGNHLMKPFVESLDGERVQGAHFPVVWRRPACA